MAGLGRGDGGIFHALRFEMRNVLVEDGTVLLAVLIHGVFLLG